MIFLFFDGVPSKAMVVWVVWSVRVDRMVRVVWGSKTSPQIKNTYKGDKLLHLLPNKIKTRTKCISRPAFAAGKKRKKTWSAEDCVVFSWHHRVTKEDKSLH